MRAESTPEQISAAVMAAPLRFSYVRDAQPGLQLDGWKDTAAPHAIIESLAREVNALQDTLDRERRRSREAREAVNELGDVASKIVRLRAQQAFHWQAFH